MAVLRTFPKINRGPGRIVTPNTTVPQGADAKLRVSATLTQAQRDNPATVLTLGMERLSALGDWEVMVSQPFEGGPNQGRQGTATPTPAFRIGLTDFQGQTIRAFLDLPNQLNVGGVIETVAG